MKGVYIATGYLDGATLAARCAADLPAHGLRLVDGGDWWTWQENTLPPESPYMQTLRAKTILQRQQQAILEAGRILTLLNDNCGPGTGTEWECARNNGLKVYWLNCGRTKEIPPWLLAYGVRVTSLTGLLDRIKHPDFQIRGSSGEQQ